jgi:hypothetical protein
MTTTKTYKTDYYKSKPRGGGGREKIHTSKAFQKKMHTARRWQKKYITTQEKIMHVWKKFHAQQKL